MGYGFYRFYSGFSNGWRKKMKTVRKEEDKVENG